MSILYVGIFYTIRKFEKTVNQLSSHFGDMLTNYFTLIIGLTIISTSNLTWVNDILVHFAKVYTLCMVAIRKKYPPPLLLLDKTVSFRKSVYNEATFEYYR